MVHRMSFIKRLLIAAVIIFILGSVIGIVESGRCDQRSYSIGLSH